MDEYRIDRRRKDYITHYELHWKHSELVTIQVITWATVI